MKRHLPTIERRSIGKILVLALLIGAGVSGVALLSHFLIPYPAQAHTQGNLAMGGNASCTASMTSTVMYSGSAVDYRNDQPNNPFLLGDKLADSLSVTIAVDIRATYVDWSSLQVDITVTANGIQVKSWDRSGTQGGIVSTGTLLRTENCSIALAGVLIEPDRTENGIDFYDLVVIANLSASITDLKDNVVSDAISLANTWTFEVHPDSGSIEIDPPTNPAAPIFLESDGAVFGRPDDEIQITFKPRSDYPLRYELRLNGVLIQTDTWDGGDVLYTLTVVDATNDATLTVFDTYGQSNSYTHRVRFTDTQTFTKPELPTGDALPNSPFPSPVAVMGLSVASAGVFLGIVVLLRRRNSS